MPEPSFLHLSEDRVIAYHRLQAQPASDTDEVPGVVFLGGFRSDMDGTKALFLEDWARRSGRDFLRFDYTGHGRSSGRFEDGCIGDWRRDARDTITELTEGPQVLVGSSMGGWISLLLMREIPSRIAAFVGIAAAPDFTEDSMWRAMSASQRKELMHKGTLDLPSDYSDEPFVITRRLIVDGRENLALREPVNAAFPVRLLHGMRDADVPWETATRLAEHITGGDVQVTLLRGSDHRMSGARELELLAETLDSLRVEPKMMSRKYG